MTNPNLPKTISVEISSNKKILVPAREWIILPGAKKIRITKVPPFKKLIKLKVDAGFKLNRFDNAAGLIYHTSHFWRVLKIADNYDEALPVSTEYRRCLLCSSPICTSIIWASGEKLNKELISRGYFIYASRCLREKGDFYYLTVREIRSKSEKNSISEDGCMVCLSPRVRKLTKMSDLVSVGRSSDNKEAGDFKFYHISTTEDVFSLEFLASRIESGMLYKCENCNTIFDNSTRAGYLPADTHIAEEKTFSYVDFTKMVDELKKRSE